LTGRFVLVLQHVEWERPGLIGTALDAAGIPRQLRNVLPENDFAVLPELDELAGVVLLGGPMGARDVDVHPGLALEAELARRAAGAGVPLLGVCLGHQLIATALGGELVSGADHEIGVGTVDVVSDGVLGAAGTVLPVLHWHDDTATAPSGARVLAATPGTPNQAFAVDDHVLGTQFHLEVTRADLDRWLAAPTMTAGLTPSDTAALRTGFDARCAAVHAAADVVLQRFSGLVQDRRG
jgi:GMP synthase (glutamine-hydrolysing)